MPHNDDNTRRATAEQISHIRPQWLVLWGPYSRQYWAFALFDMQPRTFVHAAHPDALITRMDQAERQYRIRRPEKEVTGGDTTSP